MVWFGLLVCLFVFPLVYILYPIVGLLDCVLRVGGKISQPKLLKLCYLIGVEIRQIIVHTQAEIQDKCSETLHHFLASTCWTLCGRIAL